MSSPAFVVNTFEMLRCDACQTLFVAQLPEQAQLAAIYLDEGYHQITELEAQRLRSEADMRARRLHDLGCRSILEIGCGHGFFLDAAAELGIEVQGIDPTPGAQPARSRGHTVHGCWLEEFRPKATEFDAVVAWEVVEHVRDPSDMLQTIRELLQPGGVVALSTPSCSGLPARLLGAQFPMICPPDHLMVCSRRGLTLLLAERGIQAQHWSSFSNLGTPEIERGLRKYLFGSRPWAKAITPALAPAALLPVRMMDWLGLGTSYEVYGRVHTH